MNNIDLILFTVSNNSIEYGIGTYINNLITGLYRQENVKVTVVHCLAEEEQNFRIENIESVKHIYIPKPKLAYINLFNPNDAGEKKKYGRRVCDLLYPILNESKDVVIHFNQSILSFLCEELKKRYEVRVVFTLHFLSWQFLYENSIAAYDVAIQEVEGHIPFFTSIDHNEMEMCRLSDHMICLTAGAKKFIMEAYGIKNEEISLIKNGIDVKYDVKENDFPDLKKALGFSENDFIVLFVGRIVKSKGLDYLLGAFDKYVNHYGEKNAKLVIVGSGQFDTFLSQTKNIWSNIIWTGRLNRAELDDLYKISDVGITTSFFEQCSYTVLEMMHHGIPLIYTDCNGLNEMLIDDYSGIKIPLEFSSDRGYVIDIYEICNQLQLLQHDKEKYIRIQDNVRNHAETNFSQQKWIASTISVYNGLLSY
jgi:glycosyltransferase